ncbi:MAG: hypothetical protein EOO63_09820 [Hymenobacter sp.]|nr:MAG: hypothetical protein EOO63_09820 [Hymenobacter sp.]
MKHLFCLLLCVALASPCAAQTKPSDLLLVGTFHFANPGLDMVKLKSVDILGPKAQADLEMLTDKIARLQPTKIFVEAEWSRQEELDELYKQYLAGTYQTYITAKFPASRHSFYLKNEIMQLAFRAGKKAGVPRIYGLDYTQTSFPYDSVLRVMQQAHQEPLIKQLEESHREAEAAENQKLATLSLPRILLDYNTPQSLAANKGVYLNLLNRAGSVGNFAGSYLVSEWYRRNLYMYSVVQKTVTPTDGPVLVLVGAGHAAMMREFVQYDKRFRLRELKDVMK